jgi:hypothetical protein
MNARNIHVEAPNACTMIRLPPDTASDSRNCVEAALPMAMTMHATAPAEWISVSAWRNRGRPA